MHQRNTDYKAKHGVYMNMTRAICYVDGVEAEILVTNPLDKSSTSSYDKEVTFFLQLLIKYLPNYTNKNVSVSVSERMLNKFINIKLNHLYEYMRFSEGKDILHDSLATDEDLINGVFYDDYVLSARGATAGIVQAYTPPLARAMDSTTHLCKFVSSTYKPYQNHKEPDHELYLEYLNSVYVRDTTIIAGVQLAGLSDEEIAQEIKKRKGKHSFSSLNKKLLNHTNVSR